MSGPSGSWGGAMPRGHQQDRHHPDQQHGGSAPRGHCRICQGRDWQAAVTSAVGRGKGLGNPEVGLEPVLLNSLILRPMCWNSQLQDAPSGNCWVTLVNLVGLKLVKLCHQAGLWHLKPLGCLEAVRPSPWDGTACHGDDSPHAYLSIRISNLNDPSHACLWII